MSFVNFRPADRSHGSHRRPAGFCGDRRGAHLVEMAIILPVFLTFLLMLFEVAYDQFVQTSLESAVQITAFQEQTGQIQTGNVNGKPSTANANAASFIKMALCTNATGSLLNCNSLFVQFQIFNAASCPDFYGATNGGLPVSAGNLQLANYVGANGQGQGGSAAQPPCTSNTTGTTGGFCNPGPNEFVIMSAVEVVPSFLGGLFPGLTYKYGGSFMHGAIATSAFYTEGYVASGVPNQC